MRTAAAPVVAWLRALAVVAVAVALDQLTKATVRARLRPGARHEIGLGVDLVHVRNRGIAFGLLTQRGTLLTVLTFAALAVLVGYFALHSTRRLLWLPTGLLVGGALGNVLDRVRHGAVTDFIDFPLWPAFNLADAAITVGVILLLVALDLAREDRDGARRRA
ncbi:MAG TPA: signal peptidase II [Solirubrobacteraceae bacterium]|nr:signal peptidase II [Solirubrobacteraceae bacterium]